ncbi:MAG: putative zinc-binding peptidase [Chitinophagaceae bacterium]
MKVFNCTHCGQLLYFENSHCEQCGYNLGFQSEFLQLLPLVENEDGTMNIYMNDATSYRYCANHEYGICNWLVDASGNHSYCQACQLNRTIPDLSKPEYFRRWKVIENAKHRLIYSILRLGLSVIPKHQEPGTGLSFDFVSDEGLDDEEKILTGHDNGLITLNIAEADDIEREMTRRAMDEVYRTVLGHFRHEVGHYYWNRLIDGTKYLDEFRKLFGDERQDYGEALKVHYNQGAPAGWNLEFISSYASTHPWEDWAESWAHYLHIVDTLETAFSFGLSIQPGLPKFSKNLVANITDDPYRLEDFDSMLNLWLPFTFAMNSVNRSMGQPDLYPFVIRPKVINKMRFIHNVCYQGNRQAVDETA